MKIKKFLLVSSAIATIPISPLLAIKTNDGGMVDDNVGLEFTQAIVTMSDTSTSSVISSSPVAGIVWVSPYTAENLPLATVLPGDVIRAKSGYYMVIDK